MRTIRIGNGAGFWGDNLDAPRRLAERGNLDYLTLEYLAELTMSILAHQRSRDPDAGFVSDLPTVLRSLVSSLQSQTQLKVVTNGGGVNPRSAARRVAEVLAEAGLAETRIAVVDGDDLLPDLDRLTTAGEAFSHFDTGRPLSDVRPAVASANAYLGAPGIAQALAGGARIVITGRVADASLTVGPVVHEFGWSWTDWNRLGAATVAGHLIECGAQVTGGMCSAGTDALWNTLADVGYPIVEITDGDPPRIAITKPDGTGGEVSVVTVSEQLVYEIGDPRHYLTPDVDADFSQTRLTQIGADRVEVAGAFGGPAPERLKVSIAYRDGFMASGTLVVCGPDAERKARVCGELILARVRSAGHELARSNIEVLGTGDTLPGVWPRSTDLREVVLRVTVHDPSRTAVDRFLREFAPLVASGPTGVTGYTGPRPPSFPVFAYWPTTVTRQHASPRIIVQTASEWVSFAKSDPV
ncbi:MAG: DUF1446 domain-containing protein [Planctomycetales bacterium]|nr:DUF1446 domain-containing protein [Planctomycetales bacterium]